MDGIHDMGGMHGFGEIAPELDEPLFHHDWERRVLALTLAASSHGRWNIDMGRAFRERTPPATYLDYSYYEIWLDALERLLVATELISLEELKAGRAIDNSVRGDRPLRPLAADAVEKVLRAGGPARRPEGARQRFTVGDTVRVRNFHPEGHTRAPRYVRGHVGVVVADNGFQVFPDSNALGQGEAPERCYNVRFSARELWGAEAEADDAIHVDLWDNYLEMAETRP